MWPAAQPSRPFCAERIFSDIRFGEESINRVIRWMEKQNTSESAAILDIGTGNGVFLVELVCHSIPVR